MNQNADTTYFAEKKNLLIKRMPKLRIYLQEFLRIFILWNDNSLQQCIFLEMKTNYHAVNKNFLYLKMRNK